MESQELLSVLIKSIEGLNEKLDKIDERLRVVEKALAKESGRYSGLVSAKDIFLVLAGVGALILSGVCHPILTISKETFIMRTLLISMFLCVFVVITGYADFTVRVIYFQPTDAPAVVPDAKIRNAVEQTQKFYADEMERHKFGRKTFRLERDTTGEIVVHHIKSRYTANNFFNRTQENLLAELPANMKNQNDILLSFIGNLQGVAGGWNGQGAGFFEHNCGACRGWAAVADKSGDFTESTVAHELGHAFGLYHNLAGKQGATLLMWHAGKLDFYEARLLNKSRYFNTNNHIVRPPPRIATPKPPEMIREETVRFSTNITAGQGLYQAQLFRDSDHCVLDWTRLSGNSETEATELHVTTSFLQMPGY